MSDDSEFWEGFISALLERCREAEVKAKNG
jgi:hypothetical protein